MGVGMQPEASRFLDPERLEPTLAALPPDEARWLTSYISEARFFFGVIGSDLSGAGRRRIVELGSGCGLLALMLAALGHEVVAVEPESGGFSRMRQFRELLLACWPGDVPAVQWVDGTQGDLPAEAAGSFDYGFAVNVVEHVPDVGQFLGGAVTLLAPGRGFRFICPNYAFPYEPHFNMPTLFSKALTQRVMRVRIDQPNGLRDSRALWDELSWPTVRSVRRAVGSSAGLSFSADATVAYLRRPAADPSFAERKGPLIAGLGNGLAGIPAALFTMLPPESLPIIDGRLIRSAS